MLDFVENQIILPTNKKEEYQKINIKERKKFKITGKRKLLFENNNTIKNNTLFN